MLPLASLVEGHCKRSRKVTYTFACCVMTIITVTVSRMPQIIHAKGIDVFIMLL